MDVLEIMWSNDDESFAGYSCGRYTVISAAKLINIVIQFMLDYKDDEKHMMIVKEENNL